MTQANVVRDKAEFSYVNDVCLKCQAVICLWYEDLGMGRDRFTRLGG